MISRGVLKETTRSTSTLVLLKRRRTPTKSRSLSRRSKRISTPLTKMLWPSWARKIEEFLIPSFLKVADLYVVSRKPAPEVKKEDAKTAQEDYYKTFRTNVLLAWTLSNGALAVGIVSASTKDKDSLVGGYMGFVLFSVAGLAGTSHLEARSGTLAD